MHRKRTYKARNPANGHILATSPTIPLLVGAAIDGRTREARMYRPLLEDFIIDRGGVDQMSGAEIELARRAAGAGVLAAKLEGLIIEGRDIDVAMYTQLISAQGRTLSKLGLKRHARDVTPPDPLA